MNSGRKFPDQSWLGDFRSLPRASVAPQSPFSLVRYCIIVRWTGGRFVPRVGRFDRPNIHSALRFIHRFFHLIYSGFSWLWAFQDGAVGHLLIMIAAHYRYHCMGLHGKTTGIKYVRRAFNFSSASARLETFIVQIYRHSEYTPDPQTTSGYLFLAYAHAFLGRNLYLKRAYENHGLKLLITRMLQKRVETCHSPMIANKWKLFF